MSIKKQFDQIKAEQKRQEYLQKLKEEAERAADEICWQESQRALADVLKELDIKNSLTEIRDNFWKLGEITVESIKKVSGSATFISRLVATWEIFVPAGSVNQSEWNYDHWDDHVENESESLEIEVKAIRDHVSVKITRMSDTNPRPSWESKARATKAFDFNGPKDKQKLEELLLQDCLDNEKFFPYTKIKEEEAKQIPKWLKRK